MNATGPEPGRGPKHTRDRARHGRGRRVVNGVKIPITRPAAPWHADCDEPLPVPKTPPPGMRARRLRTEGIS